MPLFVPSYLVTPVLCPYIVYLHCKSRIWRSLLSRVIVRFLEIFLWSGARVDGGQADPRLRLH